jgi:alpha-glucosidase
LPTKPAPLASKVNVPITAPHHDGSELYLSNAAPELGEKVEFKVRSDINQNIETVLIRIYMDGEPRFHELKRGKAKEGENWWSCKLEVINRQTAYRFLLITGDTFTWLNAAGVSDSDVTSANDFQLIASRKNPEWIRASVFYQIFPDRFATTGKYIDQAPERFVRRDWKDLPQGKDKTTGIELFGGDLDGVREHLDHLVDLGVNGIYFTPVFPARSTHRYDASSFDQIDPILGGNKAMASLLKVAKAKGFNLLGDLTTNHCGAGHPWIQRALKDKNSTERSFFYWDSKADHGYEGWWGLASLPKLNYASKVLRQRMYEGPNSVVKKWLKAPYSMSGWRIDVGNMTGKYHAQDLNLEVTRGIRKALDEVNPDAWLVAENADNFPVDLDGDGWHGTMNYNGFMRSVWGWLKQNPDIKFGFFGLPSPIPNFSGVQMVAGMRSFNAGIPWRSLVSSMTLLDSHDTARFRNVVGGNRDRHLAGMGLLLTYPGVPSIFAGDEIGLQGAWGEDARRTINWDDRSGWDHDFLSQVSQLVAIRRKSHALSDGGMQWVRVENNWIAFIRESKKEKLLIVISREKAKCGVADVLRGRKVKTLFGPEIIEGKISFSNAGVGIYKLLKSVS